MAVAILVLIVLGSAIPIAALVIALRRANKIRDSIITDTALLRGLYASLEEADQDSPDAAAINTEIDSVLGRHGQLRLSFDDFAVLQMLTLANIANPIVPAAKLELVMIGTGLLCQMLAAVLALGLV